MSKIIYTTNSDQTLVRGSVTTDDSKSVITDFCKNWTAKAVPWDFCDIPDNPSLPGGMSDGWVLVITPAGVTYHQTYQGFNTLDWAKHLVANGDIKDDFVIVDSKHDGPIPSISIESFDYYYGDDAIVTNMTVK